MCYTTSLLSLPFCSAHMVWACEHVRMYVLVCVCIHMYLRVSVCTYVLSCSGFVPSPGLLRYLHPPPASDTVRIDTGVTQGELQTAGVLIVSEVLGGQIGVNNVSSRTFLWCSVASYVHLGVLLCSLCVWEGVGVAVRGWVWVGVAVGVAVGVNPLSCVPCL